MKIRQLKQTCFCCFNPFRAIPQQNNPATPMIFDFTGPAIAELCIHNAHPPPCSFLLS